jgi:serine/threonine protein kinase
MDIQKVYCVNPRCSHPLNLADQEYCASCGASLSLIQRYRSVKPLAQGGFGKTFLAIDDQLPSHPYCVVKQLFFQEQGEQINQKIVQLFQQEAERLEELGHHPQIPTFLARFEQEGQLYLVQEYIEGVSLSEEVWQGGKEPEAKIWELLTDLLPVLQYVHDRHIIHRDLKPDNIMRRHEDHKLMLIDFGVSRVFTETAMIGGATIVGTPEFMAPETTRGKVLPASDLYSLGVTCLRLLTQQSTTDLFDVMEEKWSWRKAIPRGVYVTHRLGKILDKLIDPSLRDRYQSAQEVLLEVEPNLRQNEYQIYTTFPSPKVPTPQAKLVQLRHEPTALSSNQISDPQNQGISPLESDQSKANLINLERLTKFLTCQDWQKADEETAELLCQLAQKQIGRYLFNSDIAKLPCEGLILIDQLWVKLSNGHFGFSVQKQIYQEVKEDYTLFCDRIGWVAYRPHSETVGLSFSLKAPKGHLPSRRWVGGYAWWRHAQILVQKLIECGI